MNSSVTKEQFNLFHSIDRELYTILVITLWCDPSEAMQIMAFLLWLERAGCRSLVHKMLSLPYTLINGLAEEVLFCMQCIRSVNANANFALLAEGFDIPLLQCLVTKDLSLQFFVQNRLAAMNGIAKINNEVCIRAFSDIMQKAISRNVAQRLIDSLCLMAPQVGSGSQQVPADERTLFVTFSKGYPVLEEEVRHFFTNAYGDCIESLIMQDVPPNEQALYARIIFHIPSTIHRILNGSHIVKFAIKGRHVWARKFVPRRPRSSPSA